MQQIATLIITFAVYVAGIRNAGISGSGGGGGATSSSNTEYALGSSNVGAIADYASYSAAYSEDFRPSQLLSEVTEVMSTTSGNVERRQSNGDSGNFRPSQIISFTSSDAQSMPKKYPPSYLEPNYRPQRISNGGPYGLVSYNKEEKQFSFPHNKEQPAAASALANTNSNIQKYLYSSATQSQSVTQQSLVPAQLHTTPILIYRDPYTNKINTSQRQLDYRPPAAEPIYQAQYTQAGRPQEYTVQSMLVVGAAQRPPAIYNQQRPQYVLEGGEHKRPGYVFDEQSSTSYSQPVYSNRYEPVASAAPPPPTNDYNRRDGDTQTERPFKGKLGVSTTASTKISYDSHDYPPPSYYKQQTSNFQSPQRQEDNPANYQQQSAYATAPAPVQTAATTMATTTTKGAIIFGRPELTSSNYANKFGNYLQGFGGGKAGDAGYYKRPPPHYSNDILYVTPRPPALPPTAPVRPAPPYFPQGNEPIRRRPPPNSNYYQYQLGEIPPPPAQQSLVGEREPPGQYYPTSQFYPTQQQQYQPQQSYQPTQSFPSSQYYPSPPNYRPPPPPQYQPQQPSSGGGGGLATLASLFSGTQQYAPQFTSLLLGGNGGGGGLLHALTGTRPLGAAGGGRPPNMQLIKALENIARNDDLECVPKVLCNMIASQTQRGQLPDFITSPAITNFLSGFPAQSPALIYGRAALLGVSGGERSCTQTYAKCPKNEYEILYYLNNHRGGFFKFFGESEEPNNSALQQSQQTQTQSAGSSGGTSLFGLLSALTGGNVPVTTTTPRPTPPPTLASFDITQGIGNFFSNILSEYIGGVEFQRRSSRAKRAVAFEDATNDEETAHDDAARIKFPEVIDSEDFHDDEDDEDTQGVVDFEDENASVPNESTDYGDSQGRVVFKSGEHSLHFFPEGNGRIGDERLKDVYLEEVIKKFNADRLEKKFKFPANADAYVEESEAHSETVDTRGEKLVHFVEENESHNGLRPTSVVSFPAPENADSPVQFEDKRKKHTRRGKAIIFKETNEASSNAPERQPREEYEAAGYEPESDNRVLFPDHYEKHIRKGKILSRPILYASNYDDYTPNMDSDHFVVSDTHRPEENDIANNEESSINYDDHKQLGPIYYSESTSLSQQHHNAQSTLVQVYNDNRQHYNRGADTYPGGTNNRYKPASSSTYTHSSAANYNDKRYSSGNTSSANKRRPYYGAVSSSAANNHYDYPNTNYVSNNRYSSRYQTTRYTTTTRSPRGSENDHNIYVTNAQGVTTHYITPDGRKVYL
ncbi:uncharacterized protein LOC118739870 [Rhagoletis pomonella]|uniref:uncharacterized protein LOC118739870 n=1 Tax=Rhagoletis pomonella TaxID=28610 RepID=UPI00177FAA5C|nr:uncharacterized protein LOC118739870 [Rhagoletis pomonella]